MLLKGRDFCAPIVSFIGSSGVGKSTLMRMLMSSDPRPLPGNPEIDDPTSSDIHAYLADLSKYNGKRYPNYSLFFFVC